MHVIMYIAYNCVGYATTQANLGIAILCSHVFKPIEVTTKMTHIFKIKLYPYISQCDTSRMYVIVQTADSCLLCALAQANLASLYVCTIHEH